MAICGEDPDIILVTEVLPKVHVGPICSALLILPGYTLFTNFEPEQIDGNIKGIRGICIYVRDYLSASEVSFPNTVFQEQLWVSIKLKGVDILYAGCIYRSPSGDSQKSVYDLCHLLQAVCTSDPSHLLIVGDFNLPQIDWDLHLCRAPETHYAHQFLSTIQDLYLFQHVKKPTRYREGVNPSLLDLVLTNEEGMVISVDYCPGLGKSDHVVLKCEMACYSSVHKSNCSKWNFNRANFQELGREVRDVNWDFLSSVDVDAGYQQFCDTLLFLQSIHIPKARSPHSRKNIYMTSQALRLKRQKYTLWSAYSRSCSPVDLARYKICRNKLRGLTRQLRRDFESQLVSSIKGNPKAFWKYSNSRTKARPKIGDLRNSLGALESHDQAKASILNEYFAGTFTSERPFTGSELISQRAGHQLTDVHISTQSVLNKLLALKPTSTPGPDELHPRVLRELGHSLAHPLKLMYRKSLDSGTLPAIWKQGMVVPIHKKGDRQSPGNYRPVSLTSVPCKVLESLIRDELMRHLDTHGLLSEHQHGFRPRRSCTTQLLDSLDAWTKMLDGNMPVDVIYLDFRKAFDLVPHNRLLHKLEIYGVSGKLLAWIRSFLSGRTQRVTVGGCQSDTVPVTSGVPQGSVLGPLLFLLYINDLPEAVSCSVKLFADDAKLFSGMTTDLDAVGMQADLDALMAWSNSWQMSFNQDKCKVMHIGSKNPAVSFHMAGHQLQSTQVERDLGVRIDSILKFREQAAAAVAKANQVLAVIRRSFALIDETTLPLLFKSLVRPHLEYGNLVWGPFNRADQRAIERVQRRAIRLVASIRHHEYRIRLRLLKLPSLYYRRRRGDMIHVYLMLHGGVDVRAGDMLKMHADGPTRGHSLRLHKPHSSCRARQDFFSVRVINDWNGLPETVVHAPSLNAFKNRLDACWEPIWYSIPDTD